MRADAILFDKDGTLFDFAATWEHWAQSFLLRASDGDRSKAEQVGRAIGFDLKAMKFAPDSIVIAGTPMEVAASLTAHFPGMSQAELLEMLNEEAEIAPQVEAVPLAPYLDGLRKMGLRLGVATNDAETPALAHLEAAGIRAVFDFVAGCDSGHGAKPGPGQLFAFAKSVGADPDRVVMVGDSTHDLFAGRSAGMQTVGVLTGLAGYDDLAPYADAVFPDISFIPKWLDG